LEANAIPKAIATSSGRRFVENVLGRFELAPRFEFILTSEDIVEGKPHPEIYLLAAQRFALGTHQLMVLEDSENGCKSAVAAGAFVVAVPGGHSRSHCFDRAALVADSLRDPRIYAALGISPPA
jgi:beta-phosphoglucomutase-like phosphatase (HAD superfamily)